MNIDHRHEAEELLAGFHTPPWQDLFGHIALYAIDLLAARLPQTPPSSTPAAPVSDAEPDQAPEDPQDATGPQKGAGRLGWLRPDVAYRSHYLVREVDGGWSGKDHDTPVWPAADWPGAVFTPLLPGFFVAPDDGRPAIWYETEDDTVMTMRRTSYNYDLFDAVAGLLETREEA